MVVSDRDSIHFGCFWGIPDRGAIEHIHSLNNISLPLNTFRGSKFEVIIQKNSVFVDI